MLVAVTRIKKWGLSGLHLTFTLVSRISLLYGYFSTNMDIQGIQQMFGVIPEKKNDCFVKNEFLKKKKKRS